MPVPRQAVQALLLIGGRARDRATTGVGQAGFRSTGEEEPRLGYFTR
jgi:hypothetical protein